ncbi:MAG: 16S rRNA processing protein RimM [Fibrobacter sp.]|nr:16S rRNA processing protein RimM [Fibrobacter sp.]
MEKDWVTIAKIRKAVGIKGEYRAEILSHDLNRHKKVRSGRLRFGSGKTLKVEVESARTSGNFWLFKFKDIDLNSAPKEINNSFLEVPFSERVAPPPDQYYPVDLVGFDILNLNGLKKGVLKEILDTPAVDTLILNIDNNEIFAPWIDECVIEINEKNKSITINFDYLKDVYPHLEENND